jgi:hypothetical protein
LFPECKGCNPCGLAYPYLPCSYFSEWPCMLWWCLCASNHLLGKLMYCSWEAHIDSITDCSYLSY